MAFREFKVSYLSVLYDIASAAPSFADFRREVERFFKGIKTGAALLTYLGGG